MTVIFRIRGRNLLDPFLCLPDYRKRRSSLSLLSFLSHLDHYIQLPILSRITKPLITMSSPNHGTNAHSHQATAGSQSGDGFDPHPPAPLLAQYVPTACDLYSPAHLFVASPQASAQHGQAPATGDHRNQAGYHWVGAQNTDSFVLHGDLMQGLGNHWKYTSPSDVERYRVGLG